MRRLIWALAIVWFAGTIAALVAFAVYIAPHTSLSHDPDDWSKFGGYVGGTLGAFYGLLAFAGVLLSIHTSQETAEIARHTLIATRRPWVTADVELAVPIEFNAGGLRLTLRFEIQNKGSDPALNVTPRWEIISARKGWQFVMQELENFCAELKRRPSGRHSGGFPIWPDHAPTPVYITATMPQSLIDEDVAADPSRAAAEHLARPPIIQPVVIGCIDYQFASSPEHHQTRFVYEVHDRGSGERALSGNLVFVTPGEVPVERLSLQPMWLLRDAFLAD